MTSRLLLVDLGWDILEAMVATGVMGAMVGMEAMEGLATHSTDMVLVMEGMEGMEVTGVAVASSEDAKGNLCFSSFDTFYKPKNHHH